MRHRRPAAKPPGLTATADVRQARAGLSQARRALRRSESLLRQAQEAQQLAERRFRSVFQQQFQFMVILSPQGHVLEFSEQLPLQAAAVPREDVIGRLLWDTVWWKDVPEVRAVWPERLRQAEQASGPVLSDDVFRSSTGQMRFASAAITAVKTAAGEVDCFVVQGTDITDRVEAERERQRLEAQLRETHKMQAIGTLAGGIAHDFNNILGAILGNLAMAQEDLGAAHPVQTRLEQIRKAGGRARSLVHQILAFSRRKPHERVVQPLQPVIEETVALLRTTLPASVALELSLCAAPLWMNADATQIPQVLMNLCTNAWHALRESGGRIEVGLERDGAHAHLWVRDDGTGIAEATRARIFEPFFTTKAMTEGTGLGLSVVHGIVAEHGGSITFDSVSGEGSTFHVLLPLAGSGDDAAPAPARGPVAPRGEGRHVLYVDDDEMMVVMVQGLLQRAGYRVTACADAPAAVAALHADPTGFDAVVTDFNMPHGSGLEVARAAGVIAPGLPVVISSGYLSEELRTAAARAGVHHLMQKEHTIEALCDVLGKALS